MADAMKIRWWKWLPFQPWRTIGLAESADEVPDRLPRNGVALVGSPDRIKWIIFDCPCRRGHRIMLNADIGRAPHWQLNGDWRLSITPSIDYDSSEMRCHYFIRNGRIIWA